MEKLGRLKGVPLREIWPAEERDFTPWLADHIDLLGEALGLPLRVLDREAGVGPFRAGLLVEDAETGAVGIVENQLGKSDHTHLGQLLTYAAGYDASIIIWVVGEAREEHVETINWLNAQSSEDIGFFLVRIEVWRIGSSPPAPRFEVVSEPNAWSRALRSAARGQGSRFALDLLHYWMEFSELARKAGIKTRKPAARNFLDVPLNAPDAHLVLRVRPSQGKIAIQVYIPERKEIFQCLFKHRAEIEAALGGPLTWSPRPETKSSIIGRERDADFNNRERWSEYQQWMLEQIQTFQRAFPKFFARCSLTPGEG